MDQRVADRRWAEPAPETTTNGVAYRVFGDGAPLVLMHGGAGSWLHWVLNVDALATRFRVLAIVDELARLFPDHFLLMAGIRNLVQSASGAFAFVVLPAIANAVDLGDYGTAAALWFCAGLAGLRSRATWRQRASSARD